MKFLLACLLALMLPLAAVASTGNAVVLSEKQKIEALISSVEKLPNAVFIRNGSEYDGAQAASHLRLKWKNAGKRIKTAEDFIRLCATGSSMSGKEYQIKFAEGRTVSSQQFFHDQLRRIETGADTVVKPGNKTAATKVAPVKTN
jgi:hypothetical protein